MNKLISECGDDYEIDLIKDTKDYFEAKVKGNKNKMKKSEFQELKELVIDCFNNVNKRLDKVEARLDKVESRLDKVESRLDKVETRLDKVESRLDKVELRLDDIEKDTKKLKLLPTISKELKVKK